MFDRDLFHERTSIPIEEQNELNTEIWSGPLPFPLPFYPIGGIPDPTQPNCSWIGKTYEQINPDLPSIEQQQLAYMLGGMHQEIEEPKPKEEKKEPEKKEEESWMKRSQLFW